METEDMIRNLASSPAATPMEDRRVMAWAVAAVVVPVALFLAVEGVRDGLGAALSQPLVLAKTLLPLLAFALALPELARLTRPEGTRETRLFRLALPVLAALVVLVLALKDPMAPALFLKPGLFGIVECLGLICLLSVVPALVGLRVLRRGAVTSPGLAGAVAGFVAATGVATGYSLFCIQDSPLFYLLWYGIAIALVTAAGGALGRRMLTW